MIVWSYGGGVQSAALGALVAQGRLPRYDAAVIADTGREASTTWTYLHDVMNPYLARNGLPEVEIAPHDLATVDLIGGTGDILMPMYTEGGKLPTFCSVEWKRRVVARHLAGRGIRDCEMWLGISLDEIHRMTTGLWPAWMRNVYPLVDLRLARADCLEVLREAGLSNPGKSACWMCPHRTNAEWRALSKDDFARAVEIERLLRARDPGVWLHKARVPLDEVDLAEPETGQLDLFCESGFCWT